MAISRRAFLKAGLAGAGALALGSLPATALAEPTSTTPMANADIHCLLDVEYADAQYVGMYLPTRGIVYSKIDEAKFVSSYSLERDLSTPPLFESLPSTRSIIGSDTRSRLSGTNTFPYCATCYLDVYWPDGRNTSGTAAFSSLSMALTAAHCVYNKEYGGFASRILLYPGKNGDFEPYGEVEPCSIYVPIEYASKSDSNFDYAALGIINARVPGCLGAQYFAISYSNAGGRDIRIDGYPGDHPGEFWGSMGPVESLASSPRRWRYTTDTTGGMSGTPLAILAGDASMSNRIIGVHTNGAGNTYPEYNSGVRIDYRMFKFMTSFRVHGEDWTS